MCKKPPACCLCLNPDCVPFEKYHEDQLYICKACHEEYKLLQTQQGRAKLNSRHVKESHRNYKLGALGQATLNEKAKRKV